MPEIQVFRSPRPKKSVLPPASKKRKATSSIEEINFDFSAREEFLTGFHRRKLHRVKMAQEEAAKKEREERIRTRKQLREERKQQLEDHIKAVDAALKATTPGMVSDDAKESEDEEGWNGIEDDDDDNAAVELLDHEEEYIDEDKYTTVTVEEVDIDKNGIHKVADEEDERDGEKEETETLRPSGQESITKKVWSKKQKKKKFRYETKLERKLTIAKQKASKRVKARVRKGEE